MGTLDSVRRGAFLDSVPFVSRWSVSYYIGSRRFDRDLCRVPGPLPLTLPPDPSVSLCTSWCLVTSP